MSVVIAFEEDGPCRKRLKIEVPQPAVEAELGRVIKDYARRVRLPGFRPGKVPLPVVKKRFHDEIEKEVLDRLMPRYWKQAEAEKSLEPLLPPQVEDVQLHEGQPMTFTATVEVRPEITIGDLDGFELPEREVEPTDDEVDEALLDLRRGYSDWKTVERPAARGDRVRGKAQELDAEGADDGEARPLVVEVGAEGFPEDLSLALTGAVAGRQVEYVAKHEAGQHGEGSDAHEHRYRIAVEAVEERELPELDDAFAAKVGTFSDAAALRKAVSDRLRFQKTAMLRRERERALLEQLQTRYPVALPAGVVEQEERGLLQEYAESMASQGIDVERAQIDWEGVGRNLKPQAERRVHSRLLLDAIADARDVKLDEAEFERFLTGLAAHRKKTTFAVRQELADSGRLQSVRQQLRREQTLRQLLGDEGRTEGIDAAVETAPAESP